MSSALPPPVCPPTSCKFVSITSACTDDHLHDTRGPGAVAAPRIMPDIFKSLINGNNTDSRNLHLQVTILMTDDAPGLQLHLNGEWQDVAPMKDAFVINLGDLLERCVSSHGPSLHLLTAALTKGSKCAHFGVMRHLRRGYLWDAATGGQV